MHQSVASKSLAASQRLDSVGRRATFQGSPGDFGESINIDVNNARSKLLTTKRLEATRSRSKSKKHSPTRKPKAKKPKQPEETTVRKLQEALLECKAKLSRQDKTIAAQNKLIKKQEKQILALKAAFESTLKAIKD